MNKVRVKDLISLIDVVDIRSGTKVLFTSFFSDIRLVPKYLLNKEVLKITHDFDDIFIDIEEIEYFSYWKPKIDWIGQTVIDKKTKQKFHIKDITKRNYVPVVRLNNDCLLDGNELFDNYTWEDGSVIGEKNE